MSWPNPCKEARCFQAWDYSEQNISVGRNLQWSSSPTTWPLSGWPEVKAYYWGHYQSTLLNSIEPVVNQHLQIPFCRAALQPLLSRFVLVPGVTPTQMQNLAFGLVKFHAINHCPVLQSIQNPLQALIPQESLSISQFYIISNLADGAFKFCI